MKYPIQIRDIHGSKRLILPLVSMQPRSFGSFEAFIDTGSPRTILGAIDAEKLRIPFNSLKDAKPIVGFGKGNTPSLMMDHFHIAIKNLDGQLKHLTMPIVLPNLTSLRNMDHSLLNHARTIPSLVGMDFLDINKLKLFVDISGNNAYFED